MPELLRDFRIFLDSFLFPGYFRILEGVGALIIIIMTISLYYFDYQQHLPQGYASDPQNPLYSHCLAAFLAVDQQITEK